MNAFGLSKLMKRRAQLMLEIAAKQAELVKVLGEIERGLGRDRRPTRGDEKGVGTKRP